MANALTSIAFIGAGNMAEAIAKSLIASGLLPASSICAADVSSARRDLFSSLSIRCSDSARSLDPNSQVVVLAVKPQHMQSALEDARHTFIDPIFISIAAGITTRSIESVVGARPVVRVMPNTPLMIGLGASAVAPGAHATQQHLLLTRTIFAASGIVVDVAEDQLDAVTALSGSGPAYFFYLVEQMIQAGVDMGLTPEVARELAIQTAVGAGTMLRNSPDAPGELRRKVTSPGGTTQAAIEHMQACGFSQTVIDALHRARDRGKALAKA